MSLKSAALCLADDPRVPDELARVMGTRYELLSTGAAEALARLTDGDAGFVWPHQDGLSWLLPRRV